MLSPFRSWVYEKQQQSMGQSQVWLVILATKPQRQGALTQVLLKRQDSLRPIVQQRVQQVELKHYRQRGSQETQQETKVQTQVPSQVPLTTFPRRYMVELRQVAWGHVLQQRLSAQLSMNPTSHWVQAVAEVQARQLVGHLLMKTSMSLISMNLFSQQLRVTPLLQAPANLQQQKLQDCELSGCVESVFCHLTVRLGLWWVILLLVMISQQLKQFLLAMLQLQILLSMVQVRGQSQPALVFSWKNTPKRIRIAKWACRPVTIWIILLTKSPMQLAAAAEQNPSCLREPVTVRAIDAAVAQSQYAWMSYESARWGTQYCPDKVNSNQSHTLQLPLSIVLALHPESKLTWEKELTSMQQLQKQEQGVKAGQLLPQLLGA